MTLPAIRSAATALPPAAVPRDLLRLLMRRAAWVAVAVLVLALLLGLRRVNDDIDDEVGAAMTLATLVAQLGTLGTADDASALAALRRQTDGPPLRHLVLQVHGADGRLLLGPPPEPPVPAPLRWLLALHRELLSAPDARRVAWPVARPGGDRWTVSLTASHESERREAIVSLLGMLALLLACIAGLLLAMRWNLRRALAPLGQLLAAIAGIEQHDTRAVQALPAMPVGELEAVAAALRHLAAALDTAEDQRRLLSRQVLTLQDDERTRLAQELHDEFGQRLTALRVDAAWLARRCAGDATLQPVIAGMADQCQHIQRDIRALLTRLQPFGPAGSGAEAEPLARLHQLLQALVAAWQAPGRDGLPALRLDWQWRDRAAGDALPDLALPRPLALALYRISQEALTNVARHAQARQASLSLLFSGAQQPGAALRIDWCVQDDGQGLALAVPATASDPASPAGPAVQARGNGIAGLRERIWAQGGDLQIGPACADPRRPGLRLQASLHTELLSP